jgi:hypothetical protein
VGAVGSGLLVCAAFATPAFALGPSHGQFPQLTHLSANTNTSQNWFGYNQGTVEQGGKLFHSIAGDWTVPKATQHTRNQSEDASDWIGIGGGCVDANCAVGDNTLIQTGNDSAVDSAGHASYSTWWEVIPGPSIDFGLTVAPGDHMHASVSEVVPNSEVWNITLTDVTRNATATMTVPYSSSYATAEWIEETPLSLDPTSLGLTPLPNLTNPNFDLGTVNGAAPGLTASEEIALTDANNKVIGTPSAPDLDTDGFGACTWATSCSAPSSSASTSGTRSHSSSGSGRQRRSHRAARR